MSEFGSRAEPRPAERGSDPVDGPEPTQSESRMRRPGAPGRVSVRPSAFGPPRPSAPPPEPAPPAEVVVEPPTSGEVETRLPELPRPIVRSEPPSARGTDFEPRDPITNSQFANRLRLLPALEVGSPAGPGARPRRPWLSIALFAGMLALSAVTLLRYLALAGREPVEGTTPAEVSAPEADQPAAAPIAEPAVQTPRAAQAEDPQETIMTLVADANRALDAADLPEAERLFGRVIALDEDNPRAAFGLSRVRLLQGNLSGAEGWIQLAIRKRPRRAAYHAHYAEILERLGNRDEARAERKQAQGTAEGDE